MRNDCVAHRMLKLRCRPLGIFAAIALVLLAHSAIRGEDAAKPAKLESIGFFTPKLPKGFEGVECAIVRFRAADLSSTMDPSVRRCGFETLPMR